MLMSMTGFGRAESSCQGGTIAIEIQSINRKFLDVQISLPKELSGSEAECRVAISSAIGRGQISVKVQSSPQAEGIKKALPSQELLFSYKKSWEQLAVSLGYPKEVITWSFLIDKVPADSATSSADPDLRGCLMQVLSEAIDALNEMRRKEGAHLAKALQQSLKSIESHLQEIEQLSEKSVEKMRQKLEEKMKGILTLGPELDERLFREVAFFAEKVDITEELVRLAAHIDQFSSLLEGKEEMLGRKMEFLIQEMGREINTTGSKSMDAQISHLVVEIKSELEKMKEQIQNIQ